jgi:hypothetical protein
LRPFRKKPYSLSLFPCVLFRTFKQFHIVTPETEIIVIHAISFTDKLFVKQLIPFGPYKGKQTAIPVSEVVIKFNENPVSEESLVCIITGLNSVIFRRGRQLRGIDSDEPDPLTLPAVIRNDICKAYLNGVPIDDSGNSGGIQFSFIRKTDCSGNSGCVTGDEITKQNKDKNALEMLI